MRREPSLTLQGALAILGHHEPRLIKRLDTLLGGVILAAGAGAGLAAVGGPVPAPLAAIGAVWGWLEQKDEALKLLRQIINAAAGKLERTTGYERRRLIGAAHTTIVVAALIEAFEEDAAKDHSDGPKLTDAAQKDIIVRGVERPIMEFLYSEEVPAPSSARGFEETSPLFPNG